MIKNTITDEAFGAMQDALFERLDAMKAESADGEVPDRYFRGHEICEWIQKSWDLVKASQKHDPEMLLKTLFAELMEDREMKRAIAEEVVHDFGHFIFEVALLYAEEVIYAGQTKAEQDRDPRDGSEDVPGMP